MTWIAVLWGCGGSGREPPATAREVIADLRTGLGLDPTESAAVGAALARIETSGGSLDHARNVVWVATARGCRGPCLERVVDAHVDGLERGLRDVGAADRALATAGDRAVSVSDRR